MFSILSTKGTKLGTRQMLYKPRLKKKKIEDDLNTTERMQGRVSMNSE